MELNADIGPASGPWDSEAVPQSPFLDLRIIRLSPATEFSDDLPPQIVASDERRGAADTAEVLSIADTPETPAPRGDFVDAATETAAEAAGEAQAAEGSAFFVESSEALQPEAWKSTLRQGFDAHQLQFTGDLDNAAALMAAFDEGRQYVYDTFIGKGVELERPIVVVVTGESGLEFSAAVDPHQRRIYVSADFLERMSIGDIEASKEIYNRNGEMSFRGATQNLFRVTGVEEAHHDIYNQKRVTASLPQAYPSLPLTEYDAEEGEWQALRWQNMAARVMGMPEETQRVLRDRLEAAKLLRRAQRGWPVEPEQPTD